MPSSSDHLPAEKLVMRAELRARRERLSAAQPDHASRIAGFARDLELASGAVVGGYAALAGEADPSVLMADLAMLGHPLAMPRVAAKAAPLVFHAYEAGAELAPGTYGIGEPDPAAPMVYPDVLLVPLLGFDADGGRIGYGGGFYDRTLAELKARGPVTAIAIAFAGQEVARLPIGPFDQKLDAVLTEVGLRRFP